MPAPHAVIWLPAGKSVAKLESEFKFGESFIWDYNIQTINNENLKKNRPNGRKDAGITGVEVVIPKPVTTETVGKMDEFAEEMLNNKDDNECPWCRRDLKTECTWQRQRGSYAGNPTTLTENIWPNGTHIQLHPWIGPNASCQAHHLIVSECMRNNDLWKVACNEFGYNINKGRNGVLLPASMKTACHLAIPRHRGSHDATYPHYPSQVDTRIKEVEKTIIKKACTKYKDPVKKLNDTLDKISKNLCAGIGGFKLTISFDGGHYHPDSSKGCANKRSISKKREDIKSPENCDFRSNKIGGAHFANEKGLNPLYGKDHPLHNKWVNVQAKDLQPDDEHFTDFKPKKDAQ